MKPKKTSTGSTIFFCIIMYFLMIFVLLHAAHYMDLNPETSLFSAVYESLGLIIKNPFDFMPISPNIFQYIGIGTIVFAIAVLYIKVEEERNSHTANGIENGSAKWMSDMNKYNKTYSDPKGKASHDGPKNMILAKDLFLNMDTRATLRNNNILVIGGSGSGKSRFIVKPNLLQANCSFVITDPSGELLTTQGKFLEDQGYSIKVFNLVEMSHSNTYNPFAYIRDDLGVIMCINCLIKNTTPTGKGGGDPFWEKSETALLQALMFYLIKYRPPEEQNFSMIMKMLRYAEVDENNPNAQSPLDKLFEAAEKDDPTSLAVKQYKIFKMGAGKTLKSILISCSVRLSTFNLKAIEQLTAVDDIDLGSIGDKKTALFVVIPAADDTYNFLVSMMYSQLFETLYTHAETECPGKRLPHHVRFMLDEFANIGEIPQFTKKLATMRKYEISCTVILQNLAQIKTMYKDDWGSIVGNCDTMVFLGGQEQDTLEYISKGMGDATIVVRNNSRNKSAKGGGSGLSYNRSARKLMDPAELGKMPTDECIVMIRGLNPYRGKKYDYPKHKNYKFTGDSDNTFLYDYITKLDNSMVKIKNPSDLDLKIQTMLAKRKEQPVNVKDVGETAALLQRVIQNNGSTTITSSSNAKKDDDTMKNINKEKQYDEEKKELIGIIDQTIQENAIYGEDPIIIENPVLKPYRVKSLESVGDELLQKYKSTLIVVLQEVDNDNIRCQMYSKKINLKDNTANFESIFDVITLRGNKNYCSVTMSKKSYKERFEILAKSMVQKYNASTNKQEEMNFSSTVKEKKE